MDPLSMTTGVVTVLGACVTTAKVFKKIDNLRRAPDLIKALNNELSDLHLIIACISNHLERTITVKRGDQYLNDADFLQCTQILKDAEEKVLQLESFLKNRVLKPKSGQTSSLEIHRGSFFKEHGRLTRLQSQLRDARQRILTLASSLGIRGTTNIEVLLKDVHGTVNEIRSDIQKNLSTVNDRQTGIEDALMHSLSTVSSRQTGIEVAIAKGFSSMKSRQAGINTSLAQTVSTFSDRQQGFEDTLIRILESQRVMEAAVFKSSKAESMPANEGIEMSVTYSSFRGATTSCSCPRQRTSSFLQTYLGTFFIGYVAAPLASDPQCFCKYGKNLVLAYHFPTWFVKYIISLSIRFSGLIDTTFSLSVVQVLPDDHVLWDMIAEGNLNGMKELYQSGEVSIKAQTEYGMFALNQSIHRGNIATTELLLKMGADLFSRGANGRSPYVLAWTRILTNARTPEWCKRMKILLPSPDFDDLYGFSSLHKAVLDLEGHTFDADVESIQNIDIIDKGRRTPLSWAVQRGDSRIAKILLEQGADCNRQDDVGYSPLHAAADNSSTSQDSDTCVKLLIKAGVSVHLTSSYGSTALILAARHGKVSQLRLLLEAGANISAQDSMGISALHRAIDYRKLNTAIYLMNQGADISSYDVSGNNALSWAVKRNGHSIVELLLDKGQDHTRTTSSGDTLLHIIARSSDLKMLHILQRGNLEPHDIEPKNKEGLTPIEVSRKRRDVNLQWRMAFGDLLRALDKDDPVQLGNSLRMRSTATTCDSGESVGSGKQPCRRRGRCV